MHKFIVQIFDNFNIRRPKLSIVTINKLSILQKRQSFSRFFFNIFRYKTEKSQEKMKYFILLKYLVFINKKKKRLIKKFKKKINK